MEQYGKTFFDCGIRPDVILHLGTSCTGHDCWPEPAQEMFEDWPEQVWHVLGIDQPDEDYDNTEGWSDTLRLSHKRGWLVQFSTPIPTYKTPTQYSSSWGFAKMFWIYGETYEEVCEKAVTWFEAYHEQKRGEVTP